MLGWWGLVACWQTSDGSFYRETRVHFSQFNKKNTREKNKNLFCPSWRLHNNESQARGEILHSARVHRPNRLWLNSTHCWPVSLKCFSHPAVITDSQLQKQNLPSSSHPTPENDMKTMRELSEAKRFPWVKKYNLCFSVSLQVLSWWLRRCLCPQ